MLTIRAPETIHLVISSAEHLPAISRFSFFFSVNRVEFRTERLSVDQSRTIERRLARYQAVCGCSAAMIALGTGVCIGLWRGAPGLAIAGGALLAAAAAKLIAISASYAAYRLLLARVGQLLR
jgi:hypothetical protein